MLLIMLLIISLMLPYAFFVAMLAAFDGMSLFFRRC